MTGHVLFSKRRVNKPCCKLVIVSVWQEHVKTLRELEQIKTEFREAKAQNISLKENVSKLETEQDRNEKTVNKYTEIMQRQKKEISELREKIETFVQVKSDFSRYFYLKYLTSFTSHHTCHNI